MLTVIEKKCEFNETNSGGKIVLASDLAQGNLAIQELLSAEARNMAISYAASKGLASPGVSGSVSTYPVDFQGNELKEIRADIPIAAYHADIPVTARLV